MARPGDERPNFYDRVYKVVRKVPPGTVVTYGQVAVYLGSPAAARAVGYALHNLPPASDVPWWRVINAMGGISHKSRGAQVDRQHELLELEGVRFGPEGFTDLRRYRWFPGDDVDFD
ncbi:MAG: MGMT family protein [Dehalococcoidia bacterium]|nr:MGMT family protein [Dehalococcoidia bacterium]MCA9825800.1 MGMT family protein [Dehalococcoidia bacterium]